MTQRPIVPLYGVINPPEARSAFVLDRVAYDIGHPYPITLWDHDLDPKQPTLRPQGYSAYETNVSIVEEEDRRTGAKKRRRIAGNRYSLRAGGVADISQLLVHHSGGDGRNPAGMYETLHNQRGLSVHFAVEDDGRVWQFLDAVHCAWHAGKHNGISVGCECTLFPDAEENPHYYDDERRVKTGNLPHAVREEVLQGAKRRVFCMPDPQVDSLARLYAGIWVALRLALPDRTGPLSPPLAPRDEADAIPRALIRAPLRHVGLIGHLHCTASKWDPAGFPWEAFEAKVDQHVRAMARIRGL